MMNQAISQQQSELEYGQKINAALTLLGKEKRTVHQMRTLIMGLEAVMFSMPDHMTAKDFDTKHHFSPGIYMRELFIPKGTVLTGKIHKTEHLNILSQGCLTVWTEDGMKLLKSSTVIKSDPGMKRVGLAHEDTVWITVHHNPSNEQEIEKVEERLFALTFEEVFGPEYQKQIETEVKELCQP